MSEAPVEINIVVPAGIDDPARPSGGNRYDRRVIDELTALGRVVHEHRVADLDRVLSLLSELPDGAIVVVDGLLVCVAPDGDLHDVMQGNPPVTLHDVKRDNPPVTLHDVKQDAVVAACERLRVVVLLHMPFADAHPEESVRRGERAVLSAAAGVVTTSEWARNWVVRQHGVAAERVQAVPPGVDDPVGRGGRSATVARPETAGQLLCLGAVTSAKGHDTLFTALAEIADLDWQCTVAGALDLEPDYVAGLQEIALRSGIADRVVFAGPLTGDRLEVAFDDADLLVSASRRESYGMAVTEALAHGIPAVITDVGGHGEALGRLDDGTLAGVLLPPDDPDLLAGALRRWLEDPAERERLRSTADRRRTALGSWADTARGLADAIDAAALNRTDARPVSPDTTYAHR
ncbi:glycosyltransferase family 4 protein [Nocardioides immobilis]|nr:glycosyltransferase family 4 protein [Nocardioides immobilis]